MKQIEVMNRICKNDNNTEDTEECISTLCKYFKENITNMARFFKSPKHSNNKKNVKQKDFDEFQIKIFDPDNPVETPQDNDDSNQDSHLQDEDNNRNKYLLVRSSLNLLKCNRALSQSCISSLSIKDLLNKIILSNDYNEDIKKDSFSLNINSNSCSTKSSNKNSVGCMLSQNIEVQEEILKIIFFGSKGVGKTRLINNLMSREKGNNYKYHYVPTVG